MLRHILRGLCNNSSGRTLVAGAIGVLTGVEHLLSGRPQDARTAPPVKQKAQARTHYIQIRRTRSELGYTYWVLHGFGRYQGFALFDTWQEAIDESLSRIRSAGVLEEQLVPVSSERYRALAVPIS